MSAERSHPHAHETPPAEDHQAETGRQQPLAKWEISREETEAILALLGAPPEQWLSEAQPLDRWQREVQAALDLLPAYTCKTCAICKVKAGLTRLLASLQKAERR